MSTRANQFLGFAVLAITILLLLGTLAFLFGWKPEVTPWGPDRTATTPTTRYAEEDLFEFQYHAVVIGINDYGQAGAADQTWSDLDNALPDAKAIANILERDYRCKVTRLFDEEATRQNIMDTLDGLAELTWNDAVLIYFAGHGLSATEALKLGHVSWSEDEGYWIPSDGTFNSMNSYISNTDILSRLNAFKARHMLLISDTCYAGTPFKYDYKNSINLDKTNEAPPPDGTWREESHHKSSRFLIGSSDNGKALDGGPGRHSVFTGRILDYLNAPEQPIFSASELGTAVKHKVAKLSKQHVRAESLAELDHKDGQFIFVHNSVGEFPFKVNEIDAVAEMTQVMHRGEPGNAMHVLHQNSEGMAPEVHDNLLDLIDPERRTAKVDKTLDLLGAVGKEKEKHAGRPKDRSRPRVLSLRRMAPLGAEFTGAKATPIDAAFGYYFESAFQKFPLTVVNRGRLEDILIEQLLNRSKLAELKAHLDGESLLPAGFLVETERGDDTIFLRLIDVETTQVLESFAEPYKAGDKPSAVSERLAKKVKARLDEDVPIFCETLTFTSGRAFKAEIGRLHGLVPDTPLGLFDKDQKNWADVKITELGPLESLFSATWPKDAAGKAIKPDDLTSVRLEAILDVPEEEAEPPARRIRPGNIRPAQEL